MNEADACAEARKWLRYAQEDLDTADTLLHGGGVRRQICWLAQQSVEKGLKAALVFLQTDFPKTHDLGVLRNLIPTGRQVKADHPDLAELTEWAVESRCAGNWPEATLDDAKTAAAQAERVYRSLHQRLADESPSPSASPGPTLAGPVLVNPASQTICSFFGGRL